MPRRDFKTRRSILKWMPCLTGSQQSCWRAGVMWSHCCETLSGTMESLRRWELYTFYIVSGWTIPLLWATRVSYKLRLSTPQTSYLPKLPTNGCLECNYCCRCLVINHNAGHIKMVQKVIAIHPLNTWARYHFKNDNTSTLKVITIPRKYFIRHPSWKWKHSVK